MSSLRGLYPIRLGQSRLHPHLLQFLTTYACINVAITYLAKGHAIFKLGDHGEAECHQFPLKVIHPTGGLPELALSAKTLSEFPLEVSDAPLRELAKPVRAPGFQELVNDAFMPAFVNYYENHIPWISANVGTDPYQWPSVWNFARVVRNAASHAGYLSWQNDKAKPVSWHHIAYSAKKRGARVFGGDLMLGDLLVLMLELDIELDRLGCPHRP